MDVLTKTVIRTAAETPVGTSRLAPASAPVEAAGEIRSETALRYRRCRWCQSAMEHSRVLCPVCAGTDLDEEISAGFGTVSRVGAAVRTEDQWRYHIRQPCTVLLDEGFALPAVLSADQYAAVAPGARGRVHAIGGTTRSAEFRLI
jgi:hypothetical protein